MYHYVRDTESLPRPGLPSVPRAIASLSASELRAQLDHLCRVMEPITWPMLYAWTCGRGSIPHRCFLLTFDDGLADHARTVEPILRERGLRGVFFVPGVVMASRVLLSAHAIHLLLATVDSQTFERELVEALGRLDEQYATALRSVDMEAATAMYHYESPQRARLKYFLTITLPVDVRTAAVDSMFLKLIGSPARWAQHWYLGWDDLARLESLGHTIGGHGHTHEPYSRLTPAQRRSDADQVAMVLRSGLGPDIRPFSFPYGRYDTDACTACREAGFAHAFTTESRHLTGSDNVLTLPRYDTIDVAATLQKGTACELA